MVLSARFVVLACLCAALPLALPPAVEAAHLRGSHSMEKHASSSHSHSRHRTRSAMPSATHAHDGKHQGHKVNILVYLMYCIGSLVYDPLCRHRANDPRDFHPFCDATVPMITRWLTTINTRVLATTTTIIPNPLGLLLREAAIAETLAPTVVAPRYMSLASMVTRI